MQKKILVTGAAGFIGSHLVKRLKKQGHWVRGIDLKKPEFSESIADEFMIGDLTDYNHAFWAMSLPPELGNFDEIYSLAADMGGAAYIFTGDNDATVMTNSAMININVAKYASLFGIKKVFFSSSACIYPEFNQLDPNNPNCEEASAYPAQPDSEYGWEKLFSERLYMAYARNTGIDVRIARFHNIFGPESCWNNGKEKSPAAICRKVAEAKDGDSIEIWGDGQQTRSFLYIDECLDGVEKLMNSEYSKPINIGSDEMISINDLAKMVIKISGKNLSIKNVSSNALGVRGRNSDNKLIKEVLKWQPSEPLEKGIKKLYEWIQTQVNKAS
jgi:GDP-D-mannose 3', 5'-epimerase